MTFILGFLVVVLQVFLRGWKATQEIKNARLKVQS